MKDGTKYTFSGAVKKFDTIVCSYWRAETYASTKAKAISNFKYRFKKENGLLIQTPLELVGRIFAS